MSVFKYNFILIIIVIEKTIVVQIKLVNNNSYKCYNSLTKQ